VSENRLLRKIFAGKREGRTGECRQLHDDELYDVYSLQMLFGDGHVARVGENQNEYRVLVGKPEGNRPLRLPTHRWEDNIKIDFKALSWSGFIWFRMGTSGGL
jgi:prepilin-type processing-associated H-X9-DG protein